MSRKRMIALLLSCLMAVSLFFPQLSVRAETGESSVSADAAVDEQLLLWYRFNEGAGSVITDYSGHGNHGSLSSGGASRTGGIVDGALALSGESGYVKLPDGILKDTGDVTISAYVWVDPAIQTPSWLYAFGSASNTGYMFLTTNTPGNTVRFGISPTNWSGEAAVVRTPGLTKGVWKHVATVLSGTTAILYEDGKEIARNDNVTLKPSSLGQTTGNYIGRSLYASDAYFKGQVSDFRIYNRALAASELEALLESQSSAIAAKDAAALQLGDLTAVKGDLTLPQQGVYGSSIVWSSSAPATIAANGTVTRPPYGAGNAQVELTATIAYGGAVTSKVFTATVIADGGDAGAVAEDLAALEPGGDPNSLKHDLKLPTSGANGTVITWSSSDAAVISLQGKVNRPAKGSADKTVTLTAVVAKGSVTANKSFIYTVAAQEDYTAYLFSYFKTDDDTLHLAVSRDGMKWSPALNDEPIVRSTVGTGHIRDPFIIRGEDGYFYLLGTDNWSSKYIVTWNSTDLLNWKEQTLMPVMTDIPNADFTWAPQAVYDEQQQDYMIYYASRLSGGQMKMWMVRTKDFKQATTEPQVLFEASTGQDVLDADIHKIGNTYYMYYKHGFTSIRRATSDKLAGPYTNETDDLVPIGVEGPSMFKLLNEDKWILIYDYYLNGKYGASYTTDLMNFTNIDNQVDFSFGPRHGSVIPITETEYQTLLAAQPEQPEQPEPKEDPVYWYKLDENGGSTAVDTAGGSQPGQLNGGTEWVTGKEGGALRLNGSDGYVKLADGLLSNFHEVTISAWFKFDSANSGQRLFDFGTGTSEYMFLSPKADSGKLVYAIRKGGVTNLLLSKDTVSGGEWHHVAITQAGSTAVLYLDGIEQARKNDMTVLPYQLGSTTLNYLGKSQWPDPYFKGELDDFRIYNRALSKQEIQDMALEPTAVIDVELPELSGGAIWNRTAGTILLPVKLNTDITELAPELSIPLESSISPASGSVLDFSNPVTYTVTGKDGSSKVWTVTVKKVNNPVPGLFADPEVAIFNGKYYIYPTTDGYPGWGGKEFHTLSSDDLVTWKDEGVILDVSQLEWGKENAWAPSITFRDGYYYYYFSNKQEIGVAKSSSPAGPFEDALGGPLVAKGQYSDIQAIDPQVYIDDDGQAYLYFGNGNLYVQKLNQDMISFDGPAVRITPPDFREGVYTFKRNGIYYLMFSEDDTGSENYRVSYSMGNSPMGPFTKAANSPVLQKDLSLGIKATGHHSVMKIPNKDEYYVVYHRFAIPGGDGTHRETAIDRMEFNLDGTIKTIVPTLEGITEPVLLPVALEPDKATAVFRPGDSEQLIVRSVYQDGSKIEATAESNFSSSNPDVVKVSRSGQLTAVGEGAAVVTAYHYAMKAVIQVTVSDAEANGELAVSLTGAEQAVVSDEYAVTVRLSGVEAQYGTKGIFATDAVIGFDSERFEYVRTESLSQELKLTGDVVHTGSAKLQLLLAASEEGHALTQSSELARVIFKAKAQQLGQTSFTVEQFTVADDSGAEQQAQLGAPLQVRIIGTDLQALQQLIGEARELHNSSVAGYGPGQYPLEKKAALLEAIKQAEATAADAGAEAAELRIAVRTLSEAMTGFKQSVRPGYPGDFNGDSQHSVADLGMVAFYYGIASDHADWESAKRFDTNGDGFIDLVDLVLMARKILGKA